MSQSGVAVPRWVAGTRPAGLPTGSLRDCDEFSVCVLGATSGPGHAQTQLFGEFRIKAVFTGKKVDYLISSTLSMKVRSLPQNFRDYLFQREKYQKVKLQNYCRKYRVFLYLWCGKVCYK